MKIKLNNQNGFALLMTLIVVGVVLSVGVSMLDLSIKQVRLSSNAKDSEIAFHAANAGVECARYWRKKETIHMEDGAGMENVNCFGGTSINVPKSTSPAPTEEGGNDEGDAYLYTYQFDWGAGLQARCTKIDTLVVVSDSLATNPTVVNNMNTLFQGYPASSNGKLSCDPGARCTVTSVRGYNKPCDAINNYGVVEREVLLQY